jgi:hypothetical protein
MGGVWAQLDMRFEYDEEAGGKNPFWIDKLTLIQIATFTIEDPQVYTSTWKGQLQFHLEPTWNIVEDICEDQGDYSKNFDERRTNF